MNTHLAAHDDEIPPGAEARDVDGVEDAEVGVGEVAGLRELHGNQVEARLDGEDGRELLGEVGHELLDEALLGRGVRRGGEGSVHGEDEGAVHALAGEGHAQLRLLLVRDGDGGPLTEGEVAGELEFEEVAGPRSLGSGEELRGEGLVDGDDALGLREAGVSHDGLEAGVDEGLKGRVLLGVPGAGSEEFVEEFAVSVGGGGQDEFEGGFVVPLLGDLAHGVDGAPGGDVEVLDLGVDEGLLDLELVEGCGDLAQLGLVGGVGGVHDDGGLDFLDPGVVGGVLGGGEGGLRREVVEALDQGAVRGSGRFHEEVVDLVLAHSIPTAVWIEHGS